MAAIFCVAETIIERSFQWWWRCFNRKPGAKVLTKAVSLWRLFQPLTTTAHRNADFGGGAKPEMVKAAKKRQ
jgi:hypothetical protein